MEDLNNLRRRDRKIWREALAAIEHVALNPDEGIALQDEWEGARRLHFWQDKYRLIWETDHGEQTVTILLVGRRFNLKRRSIYDRERPD